MTTGGASADKRPLRIFIVAGEESGDQLGGALMRALKRRHGAIAFAGVGGETMRDEGLESLFPLNDIAVMGVLAVVRQLPRIVSRMRATTRAAVQFDPDVMVIIDSPDFTQRVARWVKKAMPDMPVVTYVAPSVWAWRPGRARAMRASVDHVMALLPFEPEAFERLGGPPCSYVGHPLSERVAMLRPDAAEMARRNADPPMVLVLPGSRPGEIRRLLPAFERAIEIVRERVANLEVVLPTVPHLAGEVSAVVRRWKVAASVIHDTEDKHRAFRRARAALAASGTVTLELALAGIPTVAAYKVAAIEAAVVRRLIKVPSVILANLILGERIVPEFLQEDCRPEMLADALLPLLAQTPERNRQLAAFARLDALMEIGTTSPAERAAAIVLAHIRARQTSPSV